MGRHTLSNIEINTLQCVIMLNTINEKIFCILWYWIFLVSRFFFYQKFQF
ncbi:unnamed protein product [Dracunculus medinensis]|uniref:Innexin n=1 Tax=Dracunculus medinensis TaxID=318479 RepID=A0A0N4UAK4_DRAME|nr:unnamed protein product [Dracunculus medinensis]